MVSQYYPSSLVKKFYWLLKHKKSSQTYQHIAIRYKHCLFKMSSTVINGKEIEDTITCCNTRMFANSHFYGDISQTKCSEKFCNHMFKQKIT